MKILAVGDVFASPGIECFRALAPRLKARYAADLVVVNAENSAPSGVGVNQKGVSSLLSAGADVLTTGNHAFRGRDYRELFESESRLLRPLNFDKRAAGRGVCVVEFKKYRVAFINLIGLSFLEPQGNFFDAFDEALASTQADFFIVDIHAEATAEKLAFAHYADGRASVVFGTHTHVQTADEQIFEGGTGYITDLGMTGVENSVLGVNIEDSIAKQRLRVPVVFTPADGPATLCGAVFEIDERTGKCISVQRVREV